MQARVLFNQDVALVGTNKYVQYEDACQDLARVGLLIRVADLVTVLLSPH